MPTIAGMRRRGYTPAAIRDFCDRIGVTKSDNFIEMALLENCVRDDLNKTAARRMAVLNPLKVVITNYPEDKTEILSAANHPQDEEGSLWASPAHRGYRAYLRIRELNCPCGLHLPARDSRQRRTLLLRSQSGTRRRQTR